MTWKELLVELPSQLVSEMGDTVCYVKNVVDRFGVTASYAWKKLELLRRWGYLRFADKQKRGRGGYVLTDWGQKMAVKWKEESNETF